MVVVQWARTHRRRLHCRQLRAVRTSHRAQLLRAAPMRVTSRLYAMGACTYVTPGPAVAKRTATAPCSRRHVEPQGFGRLARTCRTATRACLDGSRSGLSRRRAVRSRSHLSMFFGANIPSNVGYFARPPSTRHSVRSPEASDTELARLEDGVSGTMSSTAALSTSAPRSVRSHGKAPGRALAEARPVGRGGTGPRGDPDPAPAQNGRFDIVLTGRSTKARPARCCNLRRAGLAPCASCWTRLGSKACRRQRRCRGGLARRKFGTRGTCTTDPRS